jgi:hypothetical protein
VVGAKSEALRISGYFPEWIGDGDNGKRDENKEELA